MINLETLSLSSARRARQRRSGAAWRRAGVFAASAAAMSLSSSLALAGQFVVLDETWDHLPTLADSHYRVDPPASAPTNWRSPVDYTSGTAYLHLEVLTKPTDEPTKFQVCFEATPTYACTAQSPTYTATGVIDWESPFSGFWSPEGESVDWSQGIRQIAVILKDTENGKPSADNVGADRAARFMPTRVRMVVTIVEPGSEYVPPGPADPGAGGGGAGGEGAGGAPTEPGAGGAGASTSTGSTGGGGSAAASTSGTGGGEPTGQTPEPGASDDDGGCSLAPGRTSAGFAVWLSLAAAAFFARSRRRS
ncbi:MAG TPA: hypothetical protein VL242_19445 [Sorangium sp.]|nr:hypothetical protein [Sorangium sp.]